MSKDRAGPLITAHPTTRLEYALTYAALGWPVIPVQPTNKRPLTLHGVRDATTDAAVLQHWWGKWPDANIGVAMGARAGVWTVDIDPRNGGDDTWATLSRDKHVPETLYAVTGGGGQHIVFRYPADRPVPSCKLGDGIDIISDGRYMLVEPSLHPSGIAYAWDGEFSPFDGGMTGHAPSWLLGLIPDRTQTSTICRRDDWTGAAQIPDALSRELHSALASLDPDENYDRWVQVGMALKSLNAAEAFDIWREWSARGAKFKADEMPGKWASFSVGGGVSYQSVFHWAQEAGWINPMAGTAPDPQPVPVESVKVREPETTQTTPQELLTVPGVLAQVVDWYNATARRAQPQFAVQTALALGSVLMGRRWRTDEDNYSALYFMNVADTGAGKEHAKRIIEAGLTQSGLMRLLGRSGYSSGSAVVSALLHQPVHISIIDEFGRQLESAAASNNTHKRDMVTRLLEVFGRADGMLVPDGYSTMTMTEQQRDELARQVVHHPSLTLLGLSTPEAFYDALSGRAVVDGFLNRFLIVESETGVSPRRKATMTNAPAAFIEWAQSVSAASGAEGNLSGIEQGASSPPDSVIVPFTDASNALLADIDRKLIARAAELKADRLHSMLVRVQEIAQRLALIVAVSCGDESVRPEHLQWAIHYARHYAEQTIALLRSRLSNSPFEALRKEVIQIMSQSGKRGATERDLARKSTRFAALKNTRERKELLDLLARDGVAEFVTMATPSGRGRPRQAWVLIDEDAGE